MIPLADRITDPGHRPRKAQLDTGINDFLAVGPALRILQLNVEGLSAAKRSIIRSLAEKERIDVICLQETHVDEDRAERFQIPDFDLISYSLHPTFGRATYVRDNITDASQVSSAAYYDIIRIGAYHIANVYRPPSEHWNSMSSLPTLPHPAVIVGDFNSHHTDWGYESTDTNGELLNDWASINDLSLVHDSKQRGTFHSARWRRDYTPDLCWVSSINGCPQPSSIVVLGDFPHSQHRPSVLHVGLQLPVINSMPRNRWNFRKADWDGFQAATERSIPLIPVNTISVDEAFQRLLGAIHKAAHASIPRGFRRAYIPCLTEECSALLRQFEQSKDPDVADHLIESLDAARQLRWEETTSKMSFTRSSRKSWALIRKLGAAQQPPKPSHPPVRANSVAAHLVQVAKAPHDKDFDRSIKKQKRVQMGRLGGSVVPFSVDEISRALQKMKSGTAPGYDNVHPEFLKNLGVRALYWLAAFMTRVANTHTLPKIWRKSKVIAIEKPGKDLTQAANYRPISLLSTCYKLLERMVLQRISPTVDEMVNVDQAGFRPERSTCDQVAALTTYIENGFQQNLKTGTVFLDLSAAYDTVWHTGLLYKLSKSMPHWFTHLVELLLSDRRFRVHMADDTSSWRKQVNGLPQGSVLAPVLFNIYINDLPVTASRKFIYADDICLGFQSRFFSELDAVLTSDLVRISHYCHRWRLKPSILKTVCSVFHLNHIRAGQELSVTLRGQKIRHEPTPTYLGVTLDRTLTFREHISRTAKKLKSRNNLLTKLAGTRWGASADVLRSSAVALCYSVAEYCAPVWSRSAHVGKIDSQLNSTMRLITGTLRPTPTPWLPVLSNIAPPSLRRKEATDKLIGKISDHNHWPVYRDVYDHPQQRLMSRAPLWNDLEPRDLISQWRESWETASAINSSLVTDPTIRPPGFDLPRREWSLLNRFRTAQGHCHACRKTWRLTEDDRCQCGEVQTMSHIVETCPLTKLEGGLIHLHSADEDAVKWLASFGT